MQSLKNGLAKPKIIFFILITGCNSWSNINEATCFMMAFPAHNGWSEGKWRERYEDNFKRRVSLKLKRWVCLKFKSTIQCSMKLGWWSRINLQVETPASFPDGPWDAHLLFLLHTPLLPHSCSLLASISQVWSFSHLYLTIIFYSLNRIMAAQWCFQNSVHHGWYPQYATPLTC